MIPMPPSAAKPSAAVALVCGEDEFSVKRRARQVFQEWSQAVGGLDQETIDASVNNSGEALKAIARLREALLTFPFFGGSKVIWFQNCNFLGDERAAGTQAVTEALADTANELRRFDWSQVRLLVSAGKVDKRKTFYKTLEKIGAVEILDGWRLDDRHWADQAETWARRELRSFMKTIADEALALLVAQVGPNARQLSNEIEKLALYCGDRSAITPEDVAAVVTCNKQARAFALGDALGDRELPRLLRALDEELWGVKSDSRKSEIGLLNGLVSKVRCMLLIKGLMHGGWIKPEADFSRFKTQLERIPSELMPADPRFNPLTTNPYVLFKALPQARRYTTEELVRAMETLLECNQRLVMSGLDEALVLQRALVAIVGPRSSEAATTRTSGRAAESR